MTALLLQETLPTGVNYTRPIVVLFVPYLIQLDAIFKKTPASTLQHYFSWILIQNYAENLAGPYKQPWLAFQSVLPEYFLTDKLERWESYVSIVNSNLDHLIGYYFIRETFKGNSRKEVMAMINNIISTYEENFKSTAWLDKVTRDAAIKKLKATTKVIGYSTHSPDDTSKSVDTFYKGYSIAATDFFANQVQHSIWSSTYSFSQVNLPVDREGMNSLITVVNSNNHLGMSKINMPAGTLQNLFFHLGNPEYLNYANTGFIGGHEIGWWTEAPELAFTEKAQCFVGQYGNFTIKGPDNKDYNVNGEITLSENLSHNSGIKISFHAWQSHFKSDPHSKKYDSLASFLIFFISHRNHVPHADAKGVEKYTVEQSFFIAYGRQWCGKRTPELAVRLLHLDVHSPDSVRINGPVQNSPDSQRPSTALLEVS
ncbi:hypothetical protein BGZ96_010437 [Linnemannia gamsii]|uniref:Uncharacterized protein n=1 Tax=Linnemannia gamsii TaxID=64522 RepID=A0ABQ7JV17_9FUNG|nr:hypothetical protein BGZ96_010437 [Linnemannia gamsii]